MPSQTSKYNSNNANLSYKFAFNGQMQDNEVYGEGNLYSAQYWEYDARLGRRWNLDPKPNPSLSEYVCFGNNPIWLSDPLGDTVILLMDYSAADESGHMSAVYQNSTGDWSYITAEAISAGPNYPGTDGLILGANADMKITITPIPKVKYTDKQGKIQIRNMTAQEVKSAMLNDKIKTGYKYTDATQLNTTKTQDTQIAKNAKDLMQKYGKGNDSYNLYSNNCVDVIQDAIQTNTGIDMPLDINPMPKTYFKEVKDFSKNFNYDISHPYKKYNPGYNYDKDKTNVAIPNKYSITRK